MKKGIKTILWIAAIVVGLPLAVSLAAGPIAKGYLNSKGEKLVGRHIEVQHVGVNLLGGNVSVRQFTIYEEDATTPFTHFDTLQVRIRLLALPFRTANIRRFTLSGLQANVLQDGERFNFSSILDHFSPTDSTPKEKSSAPWRVKLHNLRLSHAALHYADLQSHKQLSLPDINLRVPDFALGGETESQGGLSIAFAEGGDLLLDMNYDDLLQRYRMTATINDFSLENIEPLLKDRLRFDHLRGSVDTRLVAEGDVRHLLASHIGGKVHLNDICLNADHEEIAHIDSLRLGVNNINLEQNHLDLQSLLIDGFSLRYEVEDDGNTLSALLIEQPKDSLAPTSKESKPMSFEVGNFTLREGKVIYIDHTLPDRMKLTIAAISAEAANFSSRGTNNMRLRCTLPGGGKLQGRWQGKLEQWQDFQQLHLAVEGFDLRQVNPYVVAYTGREFEDGIFGMQTTLNINHGQLDNLNTIDIYKASVGKKRRHFDPRSKVPLKTALYLLKDKNDRIQIELPIKGDVNSPDFKYSKVLWKTLGNLLVKVATSPVRGIAEALSGNADELDFLPIASGQQSLSSEQYHTLNRLSTILKADSHVEVRLERTATVDSTLDTQVRQYLEDQSVPASQFSFGITDSNSRSGYLITSFLTESEE